MAPLDRETQRWRPQPSDRHSTIPPVTRLNQRNRAALDDVAGVEMAFHLVFAHMPPGWHFKGLYLATHEGKSGNYKVGWWIAQASGPDPDRPGSQFGIKGEGRPGFPGIAEALHRLADRLEGIQEQFEDLGDAYSRQQA